MNLHEYQAKALLADYGLPVLNGTLATNKEEAIEIFSSFSSPTIVVKAQIHAGGRGKAGGISIVNSIDELIAITETLLGNRLVTHQTNVLGQPVNSILLCENIYPVKRELYLGAVIDRAKCCITFMVSTEGGVDIEQVATETPDKIFKIEIDPTIGLMPNQARQMAFALNLHGEQTKQLCSIVEGAYRAFIENDFSLFEINPLVVLQNDDLICLDAKIVLDSNALYRHKNLSALRDKTQENPREVTASELNLNYVALEGNIGCMVNGAGLAMATMDIIKLYGGEPANFLDVGGGSTKERVIEAFKLILADQNVKGILINIFGGIVRCDMIAEAIVAAIKEPGINVPVVVRLEGNLAEEGIDILNESGLKLIPAKGLDDAAQKIVKAIVA